MVTEKHWVKALEFSNLVGFGSLGDKETLGKGPRVFQPCGIWGPALKTIVAQYRMVKPLSSTDWLFFYS